MPPPAHPATLLPPWTLMWLIALTLYAAAKVATLAAANLHHIPLSRKLAYALCFPGMNAQSFFHKPPRLPRPPFPTLPVTRNILTGALLLWALARLIPPQHPLLQGWIGMIGLVLLLHFGLLQLAARACQNAGFNAPLLMNAPLRSASVTEFWSLRWNTSFRQLSHQFLFHPLARRLGPKPALLLTFALSGILHDLIISLPAAAGFGLPTLYFLLQAAAIFFERSPLGQSLLHARIINRLFAWFIIALPAPLLFHPAFITRVFLPFMTILHALPPEVHP